MTFPDDGEPSMRRSTSRSLAIAASAALAFGVAACDVEDDGMNDPAMEDPAMDDGMDDPAMDEGMDDMDADGDL